MEKRRVEMNRRPRHLRRQLSNPPDERMYPFPKFSSNDEIFRIYNMEALRIYGNHFGVFICWKCKKQFTSEEEHLKHLREHELDAEMKGDEERRSREEEEKRRKDKERQRRQQEEEEERRRQQEEEEKRRRQQEEEEKRRREEELERRRRKIFIYDEDLDQRIGEVYARGNTTVGELKLLCSIAKDRMMAFGGRELRDDETIHGAGLSENDEIRILISNEEARRREMEDEEARRQALEDMRRLEAERKARSQRFSQLMSDSKRRERLLRQRAKNLRLAYGEGHRAADQALVGKELRDQDRIFTTRRLRRSSIRSAKKRLNEKVKQGDYFHKRQWAQFD